MKRFFTIFTMLLAVSLVVFGFVSCSDDDDDNSGSNSSSESGSVTKTSGNITATASNVADIIKSLTGDATITLTGEATAETVNSVLSALKTNNIKENSSLVTIDLSVATGCSGRIDLSGLSNLTGIVLPEGYTQIYSVGGCTALKTLTIPVSVTWITASSFTSCTALQSVTFKDTAGWKGGTATSNMQAISSSDLADAAKAAQLLRSSNSVEGYMSGLGYGTANVVWMKSN